MLASMAVRAYHPIMSNLDYRTAGESHGPTVLALIEGLPVGLRIDTAFVDGELRRRQGGFGRGGRQRIESDRAEIIGGLRRGITMGSPLIVQIVNRDSRLDDTPDLTAPRPGHADFAGCVKWLTPDCRNTLERASARETAGRVAAGAIAANLLMEFGIEVVGYVRRIGPIALPTAPAIDSAALIAARDASAVYCPDEQVSAAMIEAIKDAGRDGDTLGGIVEVWVTGVAPGLGSCMRWQDKLDGRLLQAVGTIQAIKGVEIGAGFAVAERPGSAVHDEMDYDAALASTAGLGFTRRTNNAGGIEGGMTNGQTIVVRAAMKPISTLRRGLDTVDVVSREAVRSAYERSDICAVPACSVIAQNVVAFEIARVLLEKMSGDTMTELRAAYAFFLDAARRLGTA